MVKRETGYLFLVWSFFQDAGRNEKGKSGLGKWFERDCPIEWFHFQCVGLSTAPSGERYCEQWKGMAMGVHLCRQSLYK